MISGFTNKSKASPEWWGFNFFGEVLKESYLEREQPTFLRNNIAFGLVVARQSSPLEHKTNLFTFKINYYVFKILWLDQAQIYKSG